MRGLLKLSRGVQPVRIVNENGEVLHFPPLTAVEDVLQSYPLHFICQPDLNSCCDSLSDQMLPSDAELQSGNIYFLLPLSRSVNHGSQSPASQCQHRTDIGFAAPADVEKSAQPSSKEHSLNPRKLQLKIPSCLIRVRRLGLQLRQTRRRSRMKVLPEPNAQSTGRGKVKPISSGPTRRNHLWRLRLWGMSEEEELELALKQLEHHGYMCKRESSVGARLPARSPATSRPAERKPSKSSR